MTLRPPRYHRHHHRSLTAILTYDAGEGMKLIWTVDIQQLDFHHFLPLFFSGEPS